MMFLREMYAFDSLVLSVMIVFYVKHPEKMGEKTIPFEGIVKLLS